MSCIKKIKSEEISGSTFRGREISLVGDITDYNFIAKVKSPFQGKITEIAGIKNADKVFFPFESIKDLRNGKYIIEYWGDFAELGEEVFLVEELSIVSAENSSGNCSNETHVFDVKINNITIPISLDFSVVNIYNNSDSSSWGSIGGDIETQTDLIQKFGDYYTKTEVDDIIADIPVVDTSNLVPYTGANKDVNIDSNYFKTSKGFDFTKDGSNYFKVLNYGNYNSLEFYSLDISEDNFGKIKISINPEEGLSCTKNSDSSINHFQFLTDSTFSLKKFVTNEGYKIIGGTANQSLTANGGVFDLSTKLDKGGYEGTAQDLKNDIDGVANENKKATITVELISQLTTNFYAPNALRINSTALISGSGTLTLKVNDVAYTLGNLIPQGAKITAETTSQSVYNLISIYE